MGYLHSAPFPFSTSFYRVTIKGIIMDIIKTPYYRPSSCLSFLPVFSLTEGARGRKTVLSFHFLSVIIEGIKMKHIEWTCTIL